MKHPQDIDLVIVDIMMPSMDGALAIRVLKEINSDVRIVAMSGLVTGKLCSEATNTDVLAFLPKPLTTQDLLTAINEVKKR